MERKKIYSRHIKKIKSLWTPPIRPLCPGLWLTLPGGRSYSRKFKRQEKKWSQRPSTIHWHVSLLRTHKPRILGKGWKSNSISVSGYLYIWKKKSLITRNFFNLLDKQEEWKLESLKHATRCKFLARAKKVNIGKAFQRKFWVIILLGIFKLYQFFCLHVV